MSTNIDLARLKQQAQQTQDLLIAQQHIRDQAQESFDIVSKERTHVIGDALREIQLLAETKKYYATDVVDQKKAALLKGIQNVENAYDALLNQQYAAKTPGVEALFVERIAQRQTRDKVLRKFVQDPLDAQNAIDVQTYVAVVVPSYTITAATVSTTTATTTTATTTATSTTTTTATSTITSTITTATTTTTTAAPTTSTTTTSATTTVEQKRQEQAAEQKRKEQEAEQKQHELEAKQKLKEQEAEQQQKEQTAEQKRQSHCETQYSPNQHYVDECLSTVVCTNGGVCTDASQVEFNKYQQFKKDCSRFAAYDAAQLNCDICADLTECEDAQMSYDRFKQKESYCESEFPSEPYQTQCKSTIETCDDVADCAKKSKTLHHQAFCDTHFPDEVSMKSRCAKEKPCQDVTTCADNLHIQDLLTQYKIFTDIRDITRCPDRFDASLECEKGIQECKTLSDCEQTLMNLKEKQRDLYCETTHPGSTHYQAACKNDVPGCERKECKWGDNATEYVSFINVRSKLDVTTATMCTTLKDCEKALAQQNKTKFCAEKFTTPGDISACETHIRPCLDKQTCEVEANNLGLMGIPVSTEQFCQTKIFLNEPDLRKSCIDSKCASVVVDAATNPLCMDIFSRYETFKNLQKDEYCDTFQTYPQVQQQCTTIQCDRYDSCVSRAQTLEAYVQLFKDRDTFCTNEFSSRPGFEQHCKKVMRVPIQQRDQDILKNTFKDVQIYGAPTKCDPFNSHPALSTRCLENLAKCTDRPNCENTINDMYNMKQDLEIKQQFCNSLQTQNATWKAECDKLEGCKHEADCVKQLASKGILTSENYTQQRVKILQQEILSIKKATGILGGQITQISQDNQQRFENLQKTNVAGLFIDVVYQKLTNMKTELLQLEAKQKSLEQTKELLEKQLTTTLQKTPEIAGVVQSKKQTGDDVTPLKPLTDFEKQLQAQKQKQALQALKKVQETSTLTKPPVQTSSDDILQKISKALKEQAQQQSMIDTVPNFAKDRIHCADLKDVLTDYGDTNAEGVDEKTDCEKWAQSKIHTFCERQKAMLKSFAKVEDYPKAITDLGIIDSSIDCTKWTARHIGAFA